MQCQKSKYLVTFKINKKNNYKNQKCYTPFKILSKEERHTSHMPHSFLPIPSKTSDRKRAKAKTKEREREQLA